MSIRYLVMIGILGSLAGTPIWGQSENHWEEYKCRTLQSIIDMHRDDIRSLNSKKKAILLTGDSFRSQVGLVYLGQSRPIAAPKSLLVDYWRQMFKEDAPPPDAFTTEALFKEGDKEYWIAVQKPLVDVFAKEVKKGQTVKAYVIWVGAIKAGQHWEWLFAMNGFDGPYSQPIPSS